MREGRGPIAGHHVGVRDHIPLPKKPNQQPSERILGVLKEPPKPKTHAILGLEKQPLIRADDLPRPYRSRRFRLVTEPPYEGKAA